MFKKIGYVLFLFVFLFLNSCAEETNYAPVVEAATIEHIPKNGNYQVSPNETLYSIAWRYGLDYKYIARLNHLSSPYHVESGQYLRLRGKVEKQTTTVKPAAKTTVVKEIEPMKPVTHWLWPAKGLLVGNYSYLNKGINIGGHVGDGVFATAAGKVVYSGNGLRGYGNLIIIKHNKTFLTAYAHNNVVLVKEGQIVKQGQKIAEMGNSGSRRVMVHFEIRKNGKPVNPLRYLAQRA